MEMQITVKMFPSDRYQHVFIHHSKFYQYAKLYIYKIGCQFLSATPPPTHSQIRLLPWKMGNALELSTYLIVFGNPVP